MSSENKQAAPRTEVVVKKAGHTHAGKECKVGDKIQVTDRQKIWLEKQGIIDAT